MRKSITSILTACLMTVFMPMTMAPAVAAEKPTMGKLEGYMAQINPLINGNNAFTWDLLQAMQSKGGNFVISPFNLSSALSMAYMGARGQTAEQMLKVLHYPQQANRVLARDFQVLSAMLTESSGSYTLNLADGIWIQQDMVLEPTYRSILAESYAGDLYLTNFRFPNAVTDQINAFIRAETGGHIEELLAPGDIDAATQMVLASALYMKAPWAKAFDPRDTHEGTFTTIEGKSITGSFMHQVGSYPHVKGDGYSLLAIPYAGGEEAAQLVMLVILPDAQGGLPDVLSRLTLEQLEQDMAKMETVSARLMLPVFNISTRVSAKDLLQELGMVDAFTDEADFSGIDGKQDLSIGSAIHQTTFDVNEYGTEATAASAVTIGFTSAPAEPKVNFLVNHPFALTVLDIHSGQMLFAGQVVDPSDS